VLAGSQLALRHITRSRGGLDSFTLKLVPFTNQAVPMRACRQLLLIILCASVSPALIGAQPSPPKPTKEVRPSVAADDHQNDLIVLQGSVLDANGQPLADIEINAVVSIKRPKDDPQAGFRTTIVLARTTTDQQGRFRTKVRRTKSSEDISVFAYRTGHSLAWCFLKSGQESRDVTLRSNPGVALPGKVLDPQGRPLPGVAVKLRAIRSTAKGMDPWFAFWTPPELMSAWPAPAVTREDGTFSLEGISPDTEVFLEIDDERVARQKWKFLVGQDVAPLVINAEPSRNIEGQVVLGDNGVPAAATVVFTSWNGGDQHFGAVTAKTDAQGHFRVRPFASDRLDIHVVPSGDSTYQILKRRIPWPSGTATQHMVLTLHEKGWKSMDGTTRDGRLASTIEADYPTAKVERCQPTEPLSDKLSGTIVAAASLTKSDQGEASRISGLIAIEPNSGRWRVVTDAESSYLPRISPDGKCVAYSRLQPSELDLLSLEPGANPRRLATGVAGSDSSAIWRPDGQSLFISVNKPAQRDYYGEEYWGREREVWKFDITGVKQQEIPIPPLYGLYDVSHDGQWIAMHWDTHASATGAQLYIAHDDGTAIQTLARKKFQYYWYPRFHPTDKTVCEKHLDAKTDELSIRVIAVDGSHERSIMLPEKVVPETACWSPDGRFLAIPAFQSAALRGAPKIGPLFIVNELGTHIRQIALENVEELSIFDVDWTAADLVAK
jgi:hypothetical protein